MNPPVRAANPKIIELPKGAKFHEFAAVQFDENDLAAADLAMGEVVREFPTIIIDEVAKLRTAWHEASTNGDPETFKRCFQIVHDLSGYGGSFGYPLITVFGRSLSRLFKESDTSKPEIRDLIGAHVSTLYLIARDGVTGDGGALGISLARELDKAVTKFAPRPNLHTTRLQDEVTSLSAGK